MGRRTNSKTLGVIFCVVASAPALANLADPPYFNLWTAGTANAGLIQGNGMQVLLCGTGACGAGVSAADHNYAIINALTKNTGKGSGNIDPFLRFDQNLEGQGGNNSTEAAFNTDYRSPNKITGNQFGNLGTVTTIDPLNQNQTSQIGNQAKDDGAGGSPGFNHAVKFNTLIADASGYFHFLLDINEPGGDKATLRLDELAFFTSASNTLHDFVRDNEGNTAPDSMFKDGPAGGNYQKIWDMDYNNSPLQTGVSGNGQSVSNPSGTGKIGGLLLDSAINGTNGSGDFDMEVLLHKSLFNGVTGTDYVYLYNFAGAADPATDPTGAAGLAQAGFEEWAANVGPGFGHPVSEPNILALLALAAVGGIGLQRKHRPLAHTASL